ncbi:hypothetical protein Q0812_07710 [Brevundimonas sp. 2R-24]|uniref:Uncharacterized protein n=1 Tax=Peiella sedimenti TaxID=3061083 RepID=A0ABT8SLC8_9CAUL|nr:hypothetical protein [Caulobacteraceae bacterium XZ-24]
MSRNRLSPDLRRRRRGRVAAGSLGALFLVAALGVVAGLLLDRLIDLDGALDPGGEDWLDDDLFAS